MERSTTNNRSAIAEAIKRNEDAMRDILGMGSDSVGAKVNKRRKPQVGIWRVAGNSDRTRAGWADTVATAQAAGSLALAAGRKTNRVKRALLQRHIEEAESRIQRGQRNIDIQREVIAELERASRDATIAKALLALFEKALAIYVADRDQLLKRAARPMTTTFSILRTELGPSGDVG